MAKSNYRIQELSVAHPSLKGRVVPSGWQRTELAGLPRAALQSWERGMNFLEHRHGGQPELVAALLGSEWPWILQTQSSVCSCCESCRGQGRVGETAEGMRPEVQAASLQAGFSCQEGCLEVVSDQAKGAHLQTRPGPEPSGCGWARDVLPCTRLTHQVPPQTAGAPFSSSSSLVPLTWKPITLPLKKKCLQDFCSLAAYTEK